MKELFELWKAKSTEFVRLQWVYGLTAATLLVLGGLISLIDGKAGSTVAMFSLYVAGIFLVNFVVGSVINTLLGSAKPRTTRR